jgi:hypothetical protein
MNYKSNWFKKIYDFKAISLYWFRVGLRWSHHFINYYGRHHELFQHHGVSVLQVYLLDLFWFVTFYGTWSLVQLRRLSLVNEKLTTIREELQSPFQSNGSWFLFTFLFWIFLFAMDECCIRRVWRYQRGNQNPYIEEEQTTQWPKEKVQKDKQRSTKHTYKTKN